MPLVVSQCSVTQVALGRSPAGCLLGIMEAKVFPPNMASQSESEMGINSWLEDELYQQYLHDRTTVDESWKHVFEEPPATAGATRPTAPRRTAAEAAPATPARTRSRRATRAPCAAPPHASPRTWRPACRIPLATSQRTIAVKVMDENRRIINQHRTLVGKGKVSYTHLIGWAIVKALEEIPNLNHAYAETRRPAASAWCARRSTSASPSTWPARTARAT